MSGQLPFLDVRGPVGDVRRVELMNDQVVVGRLPDLNDIALQPDPQRLVTRRGHCTLQCDRGSWTLVDNGSANRTYLRRDHVDEVVSGPVALTDGDVIRILARAESDKPPVYWELTFRDPQRTYRVSAAPPATFLRYDAIQARLFRVSIAGKREIANLRPQEHKLIRYMALCNEANGQAAVMCTYEELIKAVWGDEVGHSELEINHLVWELRKKVDPDGDTQSLQSVRGLGYRLQSR
jgi:hypothetical protein